MIACTNATKASPVAHAATPEPDESANDPALTKPKFGPNIPTTLPNAEGRSNSSGTNTAA